LHSSILPASLFISSHRLPWLVREPEVLKRSLAGRAAPASYLLSLDAIAPPAQVKKRIAVADMEGGVASGGKERR